MHLGAQKTGPSRRRKVVFRLVVRRRVKHGARAVATAPHLHGDVLLRNELGVEPCKTKRLQLDQSLNSSFQ